MGDLPYNQAAEIVVVTDETNTLGITAAGEAKFNSNLTQVGSSAVSLGQKTMANSVPAVLASDQITALTPSTASAGNSSTATLGSNATFTGVFENVSNYAVIAASVFADQISAVNGLVFQWSSDGTNVDRTEPSSLTSTTNGRAFSFSVRAKFFRIVYTNGTSAQGAFRLQTTYHQTGYGHISKPLSQSLTDDNFAEPVAGATYGRLTTGTWNPIGTKTILGDNRLLVSSSNYNTEKTADNDLYLFNADAFNLPSTGTETVAVLFKNPNGSGMTFSLRRIVVSLDATANASATVKMYANPTTSANGTAVGVSSAFIGGGAAAASATPFTGPTVSANGTRLMVFNVGSGTSINPFVYDFDGTLALAANNTILFTGTPSTNNTTISITMFWVEV